LSLLFKRRSTSLAIPALAAPPTAITSLPFIIATPGTSVLAGDLSSPVGLNEAIQISTAISGPVILDLKGFALTGTGTNPSVGICIGHLNGPREPSNVYPITIRNAILRNFSLGIIAIIETGTSAIAYATDITVSHLTFYTTSIQGSSGVILNM
jgi:hypothetical protein